MSEIQQPLHPSGYDEVQPRDLNHRTPSPEPYKAAQPDPYTSSVLFVGMMALFYFVDNKLLSEWNLPVTPSWIIDNLMSACSAALMHNVSSCIGQLKWLHFSQRPHQLYNLERFDEASRGPYGSVSFLMRVKWNMASIGALVTIFRLAFFPLAQQAIGVKYAYAVVNNGSTHSVPTFGYLHTYKQNMTYESLTGVYIDELRQDPLMQSAILQGIYNISTPPIFSCSGSCQWRQPYISLGFKTVCENVTAATLGSQRCGKASTAHYSGFKLCNMTTPQGTRIQTRFSSTSFATTFRLNATSPDVIEGTGSGDVWSAAARDFPNLLKFAVYRATPITTFSGPSTEVVNENVTACTLSLTAYNYSSAHSNGSDFRFGTVREIELPAEGWHRQSQDTGIRFRGPGLELEIGILEVVTLQTYFKSSMISSEWVDGESYHNTNWGISMALMGDVNLPARFDKMAASMTDYLRSSSNRLEAHGENVQWVASFDVRWLVLLGPAAVQLAVLVFTTLTVAHNRRNRNVPLWKSSALAILSCVHDGGSGSLRGGFRDVREMRKVARESFVRLE
ncbi:hypothetical protein CDD80_2557 [Ophiocordyceps camponoti-rufipedis]|uniref:Uncharacterized protein n=1 Tax=Ophiocordyceps camponoti-rufipedis TaxID=2004952 RepID=A0A2C5ZJL8_9HYPO|nr:hypothetical protein CDD80_2557 [Ophiocordyceps camponoti-rufipedis]